MYPFKDSKKNVLMMESWLQKTVGKIICEQIKIKTELENTSEITLKKLGGICNNKTFFKFDK